MGRYRLAVSVLLLSLGSVPASAQSVVPTVTLPPYIPYPVAAREAGISGDVSVRVTVEADGHASDIVVESVPKPGVGFEESVLASVGTWRFKAGSTGGVPSRGTAVVAIPFRLTIDGDFLLDVPPERAWTELPLLLTSLGFTTRTVKASDHLLVTRSGRYRPDVLPPPDDLGFSRAVSLREISWTVAVSPLFRNARVSISSDVEVHAGTRVLYMYGNARLSAWLAARLGERLGVDAVALTDRVDDRTRMSPANPRSDGHPCVPVTVAGLGNGVMKPKLLREVRPFFPADERRASHSGSVLLKGTVTEHGTLTAMSVLEPSTDSVAFKSNAIAAASAWRFSAPMRDGCPVEAPVTIQMSFRMR